MAREGRFRRRLAYPREPNPRPALRRYLYFSDAGFLPRIAWADAPLELLFGKLVVPADAAVVTWDSIPPFYRCAA